MRQLLCFFFLLPIKTFSQTSFGENDTCISITFKENLSVSGRLDVFDAKEIPGGGYIIAGGWRVLPYVATYQAFVARLTNTGDLIWMKSYGYGTSVYEVYSTQIICSNSNNFYVSAYTGLPGETHLLFKFDYNGNASWIKRFSTLGSGVQMKAASDSGIYCVGGAHVGKLNPDGTIQWWMTYNTSHTIGLTGFCEYGDHLYLAGLNVDDYSSHLVKINKYTGTPIWVKNYSSGMPSLYYESAFTYIDAASGKLVISGFSHHFNQTGHDAAIFTLDTTGTVLSAVAYNIPGHPVSQSEFFQFNDAIKTGLYTSPIDSNDLVNVKIYPSEIKAYVATLPGFQVLRSFSSCADSGYIASVLSIGFAIPNNWTNYALIKNNYQGIDSACYQVIPATASSFTITEQPSAFTWITQTETPGNSTIQEVTSPVLNIEKICQNIQICHLETLSGPDSVCINQTFTYNTSTFGTCGNANFSLDTTYATIVNNGNNTITLQFHQSGTIKLYASLVTGCGNKKDSLIIHILPTASVLNIGPDTSICPNNSLLINAGSGFMSYQWQDNSTDSVFLVQSPGIYYVSVTDYCGNTTTDTIHVLSSAAITFDLGPNLSKCNTDSLSLTAPAGFINYNWTPNYDINQTTGQTVILFPNSDTTYHCTAEKTPGCFAYDSIYVTVHHSPPITLGADTSICNGNNLQLNAGSGFINYLWNTGASIQQITVQTVGSYSIIGTDSYGCKSYDTLKVVNVYTNPVVNLPNDSLICMGNSQILNAGNGFVNYQWSTGNNTQTISVSAVGTYWVRVTDNHGCIGNDTTIVTAILPSPSNFLPADTTLCNYASLQLKPLSTFRSYLWNTGSINRSITVSTSGTYWLQVKDNYDCVGRDTIIVNPKQCLEGFYIPSAFTPNKDGKNDFFRPLLFGKVVEYKFTIYNRWGNKVFETTDLQKGWDGKLNGVNNDTNVFVWLCTYRFEGQDEKTEKGTFVLIR